MFKILSVYLIGVGFFPKNVGGLQLMKKLGGLQLTQKFEFVFNLPRN